METLERTEVVELLKSTNTHILEGDILRHAVFDDGSIIVECDAGKIVHEGKEAPEDRHCDIFLNKSGKKCVGIFWPQQEINPLTNKLMQAVD